MRALAPLDGHTHSGLTPRWHNGIFVVVDRLSQMIRLAPLKPDYSAPFVAQLYGDHVYHHHGVPVDVICYRDPIFLSRFRRALTENFKVKIHASSSCHPPTDGQTDTMNKNIEEILKKLCGSSSKWLRSIACRGRSGVQPMAAGRHIVFAVLFQSWV